MPTIQFVTPDGAIHDVEAHAGLSLMYAAVEAGIDGIIAECGGSCSCATCHVYLEQEAFDSLPAPTAMEQGMLACVVEPEETSRLSCQVTVTEEMEGMTVRVPNSQY